MGGRGIELRTSRLNQATYQLTGCSPAWTQASSNDRLLKIAHEAVTAGHAAQDASITSLDNDASIVCQAAARSLPDAVIAR